MRIAPASISNSNSPPVAWLPPCVASAWVRPRGGVLRKARQQFQN